MIITTLFACAISLLLIGMMALQRQSHTKTKPASIYKRRRPLTMVEQAMYWRLVRSLPEHVVLAKVALIQCIGVQGPALSALSGVSLDFVICNQAMSVIAAIELNDGRAADAGNQTTHALKAEAIAVAGIKLLQWPVNRLPSEAFIAMEFYNYEQWRASNNSPGSETKRELRSA